MQICRICGQPSCVLDRNYQKVPYKPAKDASSFVCGICVVTEIYAEEQSMRRERKLKPAENQEDLRSWRKENGLTQKDLAAALGVGQSFVSKVEKGEKIMPDHWKLRLEKIAACEVI